MGFFSNLFSKQTCAFCGNQVGALARKKLADMGVVIEDGPNGTTWRKN